MSTGPVIEETVWRAVEALHRIADALERLGTVDGHLADSAAALTTLADTVREETEARAALNPTVERVDFAPGD